MKKSLLTLLLTSILLSTYSQNALHFDGNNDFVQTTYPGVLGSADRTFEAWIYMSVAPTGNKCIMDYGRNAAYSRNTFAVNANRSLTYLSGANNITSNTNVVPIGAWAHVAFVLNSGTGYFYVNGVQVGTGSLSLVNTPSGWENLKIGNRVSGGNIYFPGSIDEVRVWNVARTQTQIAATMNNEFCSAPTGLQAYYRFNHGTAGGTNTTVTSATDDAGTNNGTLTSFALTGSTSNWVTGKNIFPVTIANTFPISACGSYTLPDGTVVTTAGTYYDTVGTSVTCDTLASYVVTFTPAVIINTVNDSGCVAYTTPMGNTITSSGTYYDTVSSVGGCDSTIQYDIVISGAVDDSVYRVGARITSFDTWADHQWIRCDSNNYAIPGETNRFIDVTIPGDYAVIATRGVCVDTSDCVNFNPASISENNLINFSIYPNPANEFISLIADYDLIGSKLNVFSVNGQLILNNTLSSSRLDVSMLESGIYFIKLSTEQGEFIKKFIKN